MTLEDAAVVIGDVALPVTAPSPFLPGTNIQYALDSTSIGYLKICPRLYQYTMIEGWNSKEESVHLKFGIEYHKALQDFDMSIAAGIPHEDAIHDTIRELLTRTADWKPDHKTKNKEFLVRTVIWYFEHFRDDPAKTFVMDNGKPAVEVSFRFELDWGPQDKAYLPVGGLDGAAQPYLLCGHLDRVVNFNDELYVMDRKTTTSTPGSYYFNQYEPHNQMSLYTLASQVIFESPIRGVIIDVAQIGMGFSRFVRGFTYRTPDQIEEWLNDLRYWTSLMEGFASAGHWPMNDTACDKFGGCRFREVCSKSPQVRENFLRSDFEKLAPEDRWNPLKPR